MRAKSMVLIVIALGCGLVASIAISQVMERNGSSGNTKLETVPIYVAMSDIDVNEQLTASNVRVEEWPKSKVPEGSIADFEEIKEQFARTRMYEGEPVLKRKLIDRISGPAITIPSGYRVCSLQVRMETAVSYLINPGDRVDIMGYFRASREIPKTGTRQILRNVRVFAVNSETEQETDQDGQTIIAKTVSVLVKQDQVAKLMLAAELGTLRLALRRPNEAEASPIDESATIESLFGTNSESADDDDKSNEKPSAFATFLSGMRGLTGPGQANTAGTTSVSIPAEQTQGPAWQMVVLTPDGSQEFVWNDENELPQQGNGQGMSGPTQSGFGSGLGPRMNRWPPAGNVGGGTKVDPVPVTQQEEKAIPQPEEKKQTREEADASSD